MKNNKKSHAFESLERSKACFFHDIGKFVLSYIIKLSAGCALRRTMKLSYATATGARMCEAHSLFSFYKAKAV